MLVRWRSYLIKLTFTILPISIKTLLYRHVNWQARVVFIINSIFVIQLWWLTENLPVRTQRTYQRKNARNNSLPESWRMSLRLPSLRRVSIHEWLTISYWCSRSLSWIPLEYILFLWGKKHRTPAGRRGIYCWFCCY